MKDPFLSLLPLQFLALRIPTSRREITGGRGNQARHMSLSLAGFLVTPYGRIGVTPEVENALNRRQGTISYQVVQEFFNVAFRKFKAPMAGAEAEQYFTTVLRPLLTVNSSPALYSEALRITFRYRQSWYDALIIAAAIQARAKILYSEDLQHGLIIEGVTIENPFLPARRPHRI